MWIFLSVLIAMLVTACTPASVNRYQLIPVRNQNVATIEDVGTDAYSLVPTTGPRSAYRNTVVLQLDDFMIGFSLYELKNLVWLDVVVQNKGDTPFIINPSEFILMDSNRFAFNRLEPHAAANIFRAQVAGIPPYTPKYNYYVQATTSGYVSSSGNFSAQTNARVTQEEDPYNELGYALGAAIVASANRKLINMAARIYSIGLVDGAATPAMVNSLGGIYWQKPKIASRLFILRWASMDYEVSFSRPIR